LFHLFRLTTRVLLPGADVPLEFQGSKGMGNLRQGVMVPSARMVGQCQSGLAA
jgi:hypothetical protein